MRRALVLTGVAALTVSSLPAETRIVVSPGPSPSAPGKVRIYSLVPALERELFAYGAGGFGANVAFGDVDGDAKDEALTGPGPGSVYGPHVRAFRRDGTPLPKVSFFAYGTLRYGVNVGSADLDLPAQSQGVRDEMVTGPGPSAVFAPNVRGFALTSTGLQALAKVNFIAYATGSYGVNVTGGDVDGDLHEDIVTTPGPSPAATANVKAWSFATGQITAELSATLGTGSYGARAGAGDVDGDGFAELLVSPGPRQSQLATVTGYDYDGTAIAAIPGLGFTAFASALYGARPSAGFLDGDRFEEILVTPGPDPAIASRFKGWNYDGGSLAPIPSMDVTPFSYAYGANAAISDSSYEFRTSFLWGTATAAHQVEGGNSNNDWYEWEQLGKTADLSGEACEEYGRFDQDFQIAESLGHNAARFSLEWSRIEPQRGVFDPAAVAHYHQVFAAARAHGLQPVVTLHHFTNPIWVLSPKNPTTDLDGWESQATVDEFVAYAAFCAREYGGEVDDWITINEPVGLVTIGYLLGAFPPGYVLDIPRAEVVAANLIYGHARAYDVIHQLDTKDADSDGVAARVSIAQHLRWYLPKDPTNPNDVFAAAHLQYLGNDLFMYAVIDGMLDRDFDGAYTSPGEGFHPELAGRCDYMGLNYYGTYVVAYANLPPLYGLPQENTDPSVPKSECGTEIYPQGFFRLLESFHRRWKLPILVTENGICDADDDQRADYMVEHLRAMLRAEAFGAKITGYLHWSLVDNFEWASGYGPKFGLVEIDFRNQLRTIRPSAYVLRSMIESGTVP